MKRNPVTALLLAVCLLAPSAAAQSDADRATARQLARDGFAALKTNDYAKALDLFSRAERLYQAPTLKLGRARALAGLGKLVSAHEIYQDVVRDGPGPKPTAAFRKAVADASVEAAKLAPRLGNVIVTVEGASSVAVTLDGEPLSEAVLGVKRPIDPGAHVAAARAEGYRPAEASFRVGEGASEAVTLRLERDELPAPVADSGSPPAVQGSAPLVAQVPGGGPEPGRGAAEAQGSGGRKTLGFVALGLGGAALVAGGVTGLMAAGKRSTLGDECGGGVCPPDHRDTLDSYRTLGTVSTVAFVAGAVGVGAGAFLLITAPKAKPDAASAGVWVGPASAGIAGRF